ITSHKGSRAIYWPPKPAPIRADQSSPWDIHIRVCIAGKQWTAPIWMLVEWIWKRHARELRVEIKN
ncbi:hypothetical protein ACHAQE_004702, partial [Botrytis cinerea]